MAKERRAPETPATQPPVSDGHTSAVPTPRPLLDEIGDYTGFSTNDARLLAEARPHLEPYFDALVDAFYEAVLNNSVTAELARGDGDRIPELKCSLRNWLEGVFSGKYDEAYLQQRERIGQAHVRIDLQPRYVVAAMNLVRTRLHRAAGEAFSADARLPELHDAIGRICDIELAIMVDTYCREYASRVRNVERLALFGQLAASIGHEIRNPLAVIASSVEVLKRRIEPGSALSKQVQRIRRQVVLSEQIVEDLLELARDRDPDRTSFALETLIDQILDDLPRGRHVRFEKVIQYHGTIRADVGQIRQVLFNLLSNAVHAGGRHAEIRIVAMSDASDIVLRVEDNGPGIAPEMASRIFDPLFTTRSGGTGLGLALCKKIVEKHGGRIDAGNRRERGAFFEVRLPRTASGE